MIVHLIVAQNAAVNETYRTKTIIVHTNTKLSRRHRLLLFIGSIGPLGHMPASGTVSVALAGIPLTWLMRSHLSTTTFLIVWIAFTAVSVWVHGVGDRALGEKDSRKLVLDELSGFMLAAMLMPWNWRTVTLAFLLERAIDIIKLPPANWIERNVAGGLGVVGDDVIAGLYTLLIMLIAIRIEPFATWLTVTP